MGLFNRSKVPSADAVRLQGENHTTGYTFTAQINDLNAELREARAQIADERRRADSLMETLDASQKERDELHDWADTLLRKIEVLETEKEMNRVSQSPRIHR